MGFGEKCRSPLKPYCKNRNIAVYVRAGSERLPICRRCWKLLAREGIEWDENGIRFLAKTKLT